MRALTDKIQKNVNEEVLSPEDRGIQEFTFSFNTPVELARIALKQPDLYWFLMHEVSDDDILFSVDRYGCNGSQVRNILANVPNPFERDSNESKVNEDIGNILRSMGSKFDGWLRQKMEVEPISRLLGITIEGATALSALPLEEYQEEAKKLAMVKIATDAGISKRMAKRFVEKYYQKGMSVEDMMAPMEEMLRRYKPQVKEDKSPFQPMSPEEQSASDIGYNYQVTSHEEGRNGYDVEDWFQTKEGAVEYAMRLVKEGWKDVVIEAYSDNEDEDSEIIWHSADLGEAKSPFQPMSAEEKAKIPAPPKGEHQCLNCGEYAIRTLHSDELGDYYVCDECGASFDAPLTEAKTPFQPMGKEELDKVNSREKIEIISLGDNATRTYYSTPEKVKDIIFNQPYTPHHLLRVRVNNGTEFENYTLGELEGVKVLIGNEELFLPARVREDKSPFQPMSKEEQKTLATPKYKTIEDAVKGIYADIVQLENFSDKIGAFRIARSKTQEYATNTMTVAFDSKHITVTRSQLDQLADEFEREVQKQMKDPELQVIAMPLGEFRDIVEDNDEPSPFFFGESKSPFQPMGEEERSKIPMDPLFAKRLERQFKYFADNVRKDLNVDLSAELEQLKRDEDEVTFCNLVGDKLAKAGYYSYNSDTRFELYTTDDLLGQSIELEDGRTLPIEKVEKLAKKDYTLRKLDMEPEDAQPLLAMFFDDDEEEEEEEDMDEAKSPFQPMGRKELKALRPKKPSEEAFQRVDRLLNSKEFKKDYQRKDMLRFWQAFKAGDKGLVQELESQIDSAPMESLWAAFTDHTPYQSGVDGGVHDLNALKWWETLTGDELECGIANNDAPHWNDDQFNESKMTEASPFQPMGKEERANVRKNRPTAYILIDRNRWLSSHYDREEALKAVEEYSPDLQEDIAVWEVKPRQTMGMSAEQIYGKPSNARHSFITDLYHQTLGESVNEATPFQPMSPEEQEASDSVKQLKSLADAFAPGDVKIWYWKSTGTSTEHGNETNLMMGYQWCAKKDKLPDPNNLYKTHALLGSVDFGSIGYNEDLEFVFMHMQGEVWSPNGEARSLIQSKGLDHTSMSVGDIIEIGNRVWFVDRSGFVDLRTGHGYNNYKEN